MKVKELFQVFNPQIGARIVANGLELHEECIGTYLLAEMDIIKLQVSNIDYNDIEGILIVEVEA